MNAHTTMPRLLLSAGLLALALAVPSARAQGVLAKMDAPAALVDGKIITVSEVAQQTAAEERNLAVQYRGSELGDKIEALRREAVMRMAEDELLYAEFKKREFKVPQELLRRRMDGIIRTQSGGDREKFGQTLFEQGFTWGDFEDQVRRSVAVDLMVGEFVRRQVRVSPAEIHAYYNAHAAEFSSPARLRLSMIQIKPDGRYAGRVEETIKTVRQQVAQGADFGWLAQNYSEAADAGKTKGDLGWMKEADVQPAFLGAVKGLAAGAVAEPVTLQGSVILLKLAAREEARVAPLDAALMQQIDDKLREGAEKKRLDEYLAGLKKKFQFRLYF